jgi:hypothetical protein
MHHSFRSPIVHFIFAAALILLAPCRAEETDSSLVQDPAQRLRLEKALPGR